MKKLFTILTMMLLSLTTLFAQSNDKVSYQAVVRNSNNELVVNQAMTVTISVANEQGGAAVYEETHNVTTNTNGLMSLLIGAGTVTSGNWSDINWSTAYVTSNISYDNENITHEVAVNAVPYALYAEQANISITHEDLNNFIDTVTLPTALDVYGHVQSMNPQIKEGLKLWVAQVAKNNPNYVLDVLNFYLGNGNNVADANVQQQVNDAVQQYAANNKELAKAIVCNYLSIGTADDVNALVAALLNNTNGGRTQFQNILNAYIDSRIPATSSTQAQETSDKFTVTTDGQTSFTLTQTPNTSYLVRIYRNGILLGDNNGSNSIITVNGTTVTYNAAQNDGDALQANDKIMFYYFY